jgi:hypothetical protein
MAHKNSLNPASRLILLLVVLLLFFALLPTWPYSAGWGYYPSGGIGLLALIILLALVIKRP